MKKQDSIDHILNPTIKVSLNYPQTINTEKYNYFIDKCPGAKFIYEDIENFKKYYHEHILNNQSKIRLNDLENLRYIASELFLRIALFDQTQKAISLKKEFVSYFNGIINLIRNDLRNSYKKQLINSV